jgi:hypothetical protein
MFRLITAVALVRLCLLLVRTTNWIAYFSLLFSVSSRR